MKVRHPLHDEFEVCGREFRAAERAMESRRATDEQLENALRRYNCALRRLHAKHRAVLGESHRLRLKELLEQLARIAIGRRATQQLLAQDTREVTTAPYATPNRRAWNDGNAVSEQERQLRYDV